jgi:radical SAM superfamily enzyme YgiQ (UPF0313 family)
MKTVLLIAPHTELPYWRAVGKRPVLREKAFMMPLQIATLAGLTPEGIEVHLWDEAVQGLVCESSDIPNADLVAVTGYSTHQRRAKEIARHFRGLGIPSAVGGAGVSTSPEEYRDHFDILFIGEAELTWPRFLADWESGTYRNEYRQVTKPDLAGSPLPRWDGLTGHIDRYLVGGVQTTRGCPFDCEFCDVLYLYGRGPRHKPIPHILDEVSALQRLGVEKVFFCDDNFAGDPSFTKELLRRMIPLNNSFPRALSFSTQLSVNIAWDDEMLELLGRANFESLLIGIETPNRESLSETNKIHNLRGDLVEACRKIQSYGLPIIASLIVGFDHDTHEIFGRQLDFIQRARIPSASICILGARKGTRLWNRLRKEGRLLRVAAEGHYAPIIPKRMSRETLLSGYMDLLEKVNDWGNFALRINEMVSNVDRQFPVRGGRASLKKVMTALALIRLLNRAVARYVPGIIRNTLREAPWMLGRVFSVIATQYIQAAYLPLMRDRLEKDLEMERTEDLSLRIDRPEVVVPEGFCKVYEAVFGETLIRLQSDLIDGTRIGDALVEVFTDFLLRWGATLDEFSEYHSEFLRELVGRTAARMNAGAGSGHATGIDPDSEAGRHVPPNLAAEVLKAVEQELRLKPIARHPGRGYDCDGTGEDRWLT